MGSGTAGRSKIASPTSQQVGAGCQLGAQQGLDSLGSPTRRLSSWPGWASTTTVASGWLDFRNGGQVPLEYKGGLLKAQAQLAPSHLCYIPLVKAGRRVILDSRVGATTEGVSSGKPGSQRAPTVASIVTPTTDVPASVSAWLIFNALYICTF